MSFLSEYYDVEVLQIFGNAIGRVLRIDTNTANESRGRFARLCIQVDIEKPLITALLIGGREQRISYEGIQSLFFLWKNRTLAGEQSTCCKGGPVTDEEGG